MTMPAGAAPAEPPAEPVGWLALTASERGAAHVAVQTPNQDCVGVERAGDAGVVAAVADGHGHSRHLRSARGSKLAVSIGCRVAQELADKLGLDQPALAGQLETAEHIAELTEDFLVPAIVRQWREAVLADVAADPFTSKEEGKRRKGDDPIIAYGSTLLLCVALRYWLILAQIGDGDVVGVLTDGTATMPVPIDPQLDGMVTTSLCGANAVADFRVAVVDTRQLPLLAVLLATDGYGNAQVIEEWPSSFSKDLAWLVREHDARWLASQLPGWAARCASADGSADDTTVALLVSPAAQSGMANSPPWVDGLTDEATDVGSDEITIPAVIRTDTVPNAQLPPGRSPAESATVRLSAGDEAVAEETERALLPEAAELTTDETADDDPITADWEPPAAPPESGIR